jgi:sec-independent protein translocase protein TatA
MLSIPDMAVLGAAALLFFGPEQLPRVARKAGNVMREIQNTSQSFIRELERAADMEDAKDAKPYEQPPYDGTPYDASAYEAPVAYDTSPAYDASQYEPPAPEPDAPVADRVGEKLAEPRPALNLQAQAPEPDQERSAAAEAPPETDHAPHL